MKITDGRKHIHILLLGGTIACVLNERNESVTVDLSDYIKTFHEFDEIAEITADTFRRRKGYEMKLADITDAAREIERLIQTEQLDGIVVVMGTNVMEEAAFALNLLLQTEIPVVVTGAMRIPEARSADGPANLAAAICAALSDSLRGAGVTVVFNDTIHSADYVRKLHSMNPGAITSDFPLGYIAEGAVSLRVRPIRRLMPWIRPQAEPKDVLLYGTCLDDSGNILDCFEMAGYQGLVIEGTGGGNIAEWVFDKVERIHRSFPVCIASRTGFGDVMTKTYGSGYSRPQYMVEHGYYMAGQLDGRKARILLTLLLMSGCSKEEIVKSFAMYAKEPGLPRNF